MTQTKKASLVAIISFLVVIGFTIPATTYAQSYGGFAGYGGGGDSFFFPTAGNAPHEELYVHSWGPSSPAPTYLQHYQPSYYPSYQPQHQAQQYPSYNPLFQYAPQLANPAYQDFNSKFLNYTVIAPMNFNAVTPSYVSSMPNYSMPSHAYPSYNSYPSYGGGYAYGGGYSYGVPQSGITDFWGNPLCNWGPGYGNFPCDRDPHQWVQDPYTGEIY